MKLINPTSFFQNYVDILLSLVILPENFCKNTNGSNIMPSSDNTPDLLQDFKEVIREKANRTKTIMDFGHALFSQILEDFDRAGINEERKFTLERKSDEEAEWIDFRYDKDLISN